MDFKKISSSLLITITATILILPQKSHAAGVNEEVFRIWADKTIKNPQSGQWAENLNASTIVFGPDSPLEFKIRVKNQRGQPLAGVQITDTLPPSIIFVAGPGEYHQESRKITWALPTLEPHQEAIFDLYTKVVPADQLPPATTCVANRIEARAETGDFYFDTVRFCLGTKIPITVTPETGLDPHLAIQGLACLSLIGLGLKLRRYR